MSRQKSTRGDPCERQHPFRVGGKYLEGWTRTSKGVLSSCIEPWAPPQPVFNCLQLLFTKGTQRVCGGAKEIGVAFQQWSVAGSQARKKDSVLSVDNSHAIFGPGEPAIHLRYPRICRWWIYKCPANEGARGCIRNGPRRVAGGCSGWFGCGVCELVSRDSFVPWYPREGCRTRLSVEE